MVMYGKFTNRLGEWLLGVTCCTLSVVPQSFAVSPNSLSQSPLFLVTSADPLVMLNMSNDHQLFYKAYDDWSDIDGDSVLDTTYKHSIDYYGYFDSYKCYTYDTTDVRFEPATITNDKYCTGANDWSGNFLNWASMTRIDSVKKILYGGTRSTDSASTTVLERSYLPGDAHSFAKYYVSTTTEMANLTPWSVTEITLCNTTYAADGNSEDITAPPLIRVAGGNYALWAANERYQCHWKDHNELEGDRCYAFLGDADGDPSCRDANNGNNPAVTGLDAHHSNPDWDVHLGNGDYTVRVQACVSNALEGTENCKAYPSGNLKPAGLLQQYGDDSQILFGLMTGSFQHNKSGGVLRKNVSAIIDEIHTTTDGTFKTAPTTGNIIKNLDALRVSGYDHDPGTYNDTDNCSWGLNSFNNGSCTNWGNPQSEIYLESLRYFAGVSANGSFTSNDSSFIDNFISSSWTDPLSNANYCAPINIIHFNASITSYDDELSGASDLNSLTNLDTFTDTVGAGEGINGNSYFIGEGTSATTTDGLCTAKTLTGLSDAKGLCPEAPRLDGGFAIAGLANYAHTTSIRDDLVDIDNNEAKITTQTYGVSLAPAIPKIEIPVPAGNSVITILPACRNEDISGNCAIVDFKVVEPHTEVSGTATGKFYVNWEDSEQGGDYDQDMAGILSYVVSSTEIKVTTATFGQSTGNGMGFGYIISGTTQDGFHVHSGINGFTGYIDATGVMSCSDADVNCNNEVAATTVTYNIGTSGGGLLKDPLWYAAKWGGFKEEPDSEKRPANTDAPNDIPDQTYEWDANNDGLPDSYFFSTNPAQLAASLQNVFLSISEQQASASSTAANSQRAESGSFIFQAQFNSADWSGKLLKYSVDMNTGILSLHSSWGTNGSGDAGDTLTQSGRNIITYNPDKTGTSDDGLPFQWDDLTDPQKALLNTDPISGNTDTKGESRLDYLRGDRSLEVSTGNAGAIFRNRSRVLSDIISSAPVFVGKPDFLYPDNLEGPSVETYSAFKTRVGSRTQMLYVGGNDGMLHGLDVSYGIEEIAYVPQGIFANLAKLTSQDYTHQYYVDGSPSVGDAVFSDNLWHTVLIGGLKAGGQSIYALDVTAPSSFAEGSASQTVLWEISNNTSGFSELGYTFARPAIVKNHSGDWIAVFGNGYAGASGHAVLYVVNVQTGALISTLTVDTTGNNGLSTASPVDVDGDSKIDAIYAGDFKGNMWKFIPSTANTWQVAFGGNPLFTTPADNSGNVQPITTRPEVGLHPTGLPGVMVYFGTGKYFEIGDNLADTNVQRFYGIWDLWDEGSTSSLTGEPTTPGISVSAGNLLRQCVTTGTTAETCVANAATSTGEQLQNFDVRFISTNTISTWHWDNTLGKIGWYIDLPELGEKQVSHSILRSGRIIFITVVPSDHTCSDGGESWLMELDAADGSAMDDAVFDLNGDGIFNDQDMKSIDSDGDGTADTYIVPGGKKSKEGIIQPPSILINPDTGTEYKYSSGSTGNIERTTENPAPFTKGRKSWVQLK